MDFALSANQESIRDAVAKICTRFDDAYWLKKDKEGGFPADFHKAMAEAGWLGICIPEEYGGSGLGILDAAIMMRTISESGAGMSGASAIHMNVFGLNPVVVFGSKEQCTRMLPGIVEARADLGHGITDRFLVGGECEIHRLTPWMQSAPAASRRRGSSRRSRRLRIPPRAGSSRRAR